MFSRSLCAGTEQKGRRPGVSCGALTIWKIVLGGMVDHQGSMWSEVKEIQQSNIHDVHLHSTHFDIYLVKSQSSPWGQY